MKSKGFKNCPSVAAFAVGMRVREHNDKYTGDWFTVAIVQKDGSAISDCATKYPWSSQRSIGDFELDLSSVWVGREAKSRNSNRKVKILCLTGEFLGCSVRNRPESFVITLTDFLAGYDLLPLNSACGALDLKPSEPESWKPEVGKECWWVDPDGDVPNITVVPIGMDCGEWVCRSKPFTYIRVAETFLHHIPPEPTVKVGDNVHIARDGDVYVGRVGEVHSDSCMFKLIGYPDMWFDWTAVSTTITKLVPALESHP